MAEKKTKYRVLNPRGLPKRMVIISYHKNGHDWNWKAGAVFLPPAGFDSDGRLLREGYIEAVTDA